MDPVNKSDRPPSSRPPRGSNRSSTAQTTARRWPTGTEYAEAVQQPSVSFSDVELRSGALTLTPLGIPAMASGQNAVAFHFEAETRPVAVRCLLSENEDGSFVTKGDANATPDPWTVQPTEVIGGVVASAPHVGYWLVYLKSLPGMLSVLFAVGALVIVWPIVRDLDERRSSNAAGA